VWPDGDPVVHDDTVKLAAFMLPDAFQFVAKKLAERGRKPRKLSSP